MRQRGSTWATAGLVLLAAVAVVLSWAAIDSTSGRAAQGPHTSPFTVATEDPVTGPDAGNDRLTPSPDGDQGDGQGGDGSGDGSGDGRSDDGSDGQPADGLQSGIEPPLLMANRTVAFRAGIGSCTGRATLDHSTTAGARWTELAAPAAAVLDLSSSGGNDVRLVGADASCEVRVWTSTDAGRTWSAAGAASGLFARLPDDPRLLLAPGGVVANPCPERSKAPVSVDGVSSTSAAVLCASGDVLVSTDGGSRWVTRSPVVGGVAMAFQSSTVGWALRVNSGGCPAYQVMKTRDRALTWQTGGCVGRRQGEVSRGGAALSFSDRSHGMAVVGSAVYLTSNSGQAWKRQR